MGTSPPAGGHGRERGIRASDVDRDRDAAALSAHYAAGRLTLEEFQERLDQAYAAKTLGDLDDLMTDLPGPGPTQLGGQRDGNVPPPERRAPATVRGPVGAIWQFWLGIAIGTFVIWLISGATGGPWFLWMTIPLVFIMLRHCLMGVERRINEHHQWPR